VFLWKTTQYDTGWLAKILDIIFVYQNFGLPIRNLNIFYISGLKSRLLVQNFFGLF